MKKKSIKVNAVLNAFNTLASMVFPLITFPYVSKILSVESLGKYNFSKSVISYFLLIAGLGIANYAVREAPQYREDRAAASRFISEIFTINCCATMASCILFIFCLFSIPKLQDYTVLLLILSLEIPFTTLGVSWVYSIYENYTFITIRNILMQCISLGLLLLLVKDAGDVYWYAGITLFVCIGSGVVNFFMARRHTEIRIVTRIPWKRHMKPILVIFSTSIAITIYINSDITLLGFMTNDYVVGLYSVAGKMYRILKQLIAAIVTVSIPRCSLYVGQGLMEEYRELMKRIVNGIFIVMFPIITGLIAFGKPLVLIISNENYLAAVLSLQMLAVAILFNVLTYIAGYCILLPHKMENDFLYATVVSAVVNVVLNLMLIPKFQQNGAAFSTIVAEATALFICLRRARGVIGDMLKPDELRRNLFDVLLGCIGIAAVCFAFQQSSLNVYVNACLCVASAGALYGGILLLRRNEIVVSTVRQVMRKIKKI